MKTHYYVIGGGIFSLLVQSILQNLIPSNAEAYFESNMPSNLDSHDYRKNNKISEKAFLEIKVCNPFDFIFEQTIDNIDTKITLSPVRSFFSKNNKLSNSPNLKLYHEIYKALPWTSEVLAEFKNIDNLIDRNTEYVGVHCRLTTMNFYNGKMNTELFMKFVDEHVNGGKLIVVSDNQESLNKFIDKHGEENIIYISNQSTRFDKESADIHELQEKDFKNFFTKEFWLNGLKEAYLLSKATTVIKRTSNLNSMAMIIKGVPQNEIHVPGSL